MSPSVIDTSDDFTMPTKVAPQPTTSRTLLLSPPSLSSHEDKLTSVLEMHDRTATDMQMLDRLSAGLVSLPESTYDVIIILCDADGSRRESQRLLGRSIFEVLARTMKPGALLRSQDGHFGATHGSEKNEAILAGLSYQAGAGFLKPEHAAQEPVLLGLGRKKDSAKAAGGLNGASEGSVAVPVNGKRKSQDVSNGLPEGVRFDDGTSNGEEIDSDDELIDEDTLLDEEDLKRPVKIRRFSYGVVPGYVLTCQQRRSANRRLNDEELAKIVPAVLRPNWTQKTRQRGPMLTKH